MSDEVKKVIQEAAQMLMDAVLRILQEDPHSWSDRPCESCRTISSIVNKPFGCYEYKRRKDAGEKRYQRRR